MVSYKNFIVNFVVYKFHLQRPKPYEDKKFYWLQILAEIVIYFCYFPKIHSPVPYLGDNDNVRLTFIGHTAWQVKTLLELLFPVCFSASSLALSTSLAEEILFSHLTPDNVMVFGGTSWHLLELKVGSSFFFFLFYIYLHFVLEVCIQSMEKVPDFLFFF